jgi:hypothetical protein
LGRAGVELTEEQIQAIAKQGLKKTLAEYTLATGKTAGREGLTESAQQVFERMQAGLALTDPEARKEYFDSFLGGAVLGGIIAPVGYRFEKGQAIARSEEAIAAKKYEAELEAQKKKDEEEAKRLADQNGLLATYDQLEESKAKLKELRDAATALKPADPATATPEQIAAHAAAKKATSDYNNTTHKSVLEAYKKDQAAIDAAAAERKKKEKEEKKAAEKAAKDASKLAPPSIDPNALVEEGVDNAGVDLAATGAGDALAGAGQQPPNATGVGVSGEGGLDANQPPAGGVAGGEAAAVDPLADVPDLDAQAQATQIADLRKKWPGLSDVSDAILIANDKWSEAENRVRAAYNNQGNKAVEIHDELVNEIKQKGGAFDQLGYLTELANRLNAEADRVEADRNTEGTFANRQREAQSNKERSGPPHKAALQDIDLALQEVKELIKQGRITPSDFDEFQRIADTSTDSYSIAAQIRSLLKAKVVARENSGLGTGEAANDAATQAAAPAAPPVAPTKPKKGKAPKLTEREQAQAAIDEQLAAAKAKRAASKASKPKAARIPVDATLRKLFTKEKRTEEDLEFLNDLAPTAKLYGLKIDDYESVDDFEARLDATHEASKAWKEFNEPRVEATDKTEASGNRPEVSQIDRLREIEAEDSRAGKLYNEHREEYRKSKLEPIVNFLRDTSKGTLPTGMDWDSKALDDFLKDQGVAVPKDGFFSNEYQNQNDPAKDAAEESKILDRIRGQLREKLDKSRTTLEPWQKLTIDQKDVFLSHMPANFSTRGETLSALAKIDSYTQAIREAQGRPADLTADPAAGIYERNRVAQSKTDKVDYPSWDKLSEDQRQIFREAIVENVKQRSAAGDAKAKALLEKPEKSILKNATAEDHTAAFEEIASRLDKKDPTLATGYKETQAEVAKREYERRKALYEKREKEREEKSQEEKEERSTVGEFFRRKAEKKAAPKRLPPQVVAAIKEGNLNRVLDYMVNSAENDSFRLVAQLARAGGKINSKIKFVDQFSTYNPETKKYEPDGRVAEYDPDTDTISIAADGLEEKFVLHEIVHAVTLRVIDKYLQGKADLTTDQRDAAEHLESVMEQAKEALNKKFPRGFSDKSWGDAFADLHEFVSYAMTDPEFQAELKGITRDFASGEAAAADAKLSTKVGKPVGAGSVYETALPEKLSLWSQFAHDVAKLLGMFSPGMQRLFAKKSGKNVGTNLMAETLSVFENILSPSRADASPTGKVSARTGAAGQPDLTFDQIVGKVKTGKTDSASLWEWAKGPKFGPDLIRRFQNAQRPILDIERKYDRLNLIHHVGDKINNVWTQITLSSGKAWSNFKYRLAALEDDVHVEIKGLMEDGKLDMDKALQTAHSYMLFLHEPERRALLFARDVPLDDSNKTAIKIGNKTYSAAQARTEIFASLDNPATTPAAAKLYRKMLDKIVLDKNNYAKVDSKGVLYTKEQKDLYFDSASSKYDVSVLSQGELKNLKDGFDKMPANVKARLDAIAATMKKYQEATNEINKEANYWSPGIANRVAFNGWDHYVPLKGRGEGKDTKDSAFEPHKIGGDLQERDYAFGGRSSESENILLQTLADGARSALRLGRSDLTLSIKNAVNDGILKGDAKKKISFEDRMKNPEEFKRETSGEKIVLHYENNGDVTVIKLDSSREAEAIRRTYREAHPLLEKANFATSLVGQFHTRFNLAFTPKNFINDALTNAFTLGAQFGPKKSFQLLGEISNQVASNGIYKALKVASLLQENKTAEVEAYAAAQLAKGDSFVSDMLEYLKAGGRVSYLQGIAARGKLNELMKEIQTNGPILKSKEAITNFFDLYTDMFELASRTASYRVMSKIYLDEAVEKGLAGEKAKEYAKVRATETAKNFANFEQVGEWGKWMGAMFMFFRPAATGAVRAIDALRPAFDKLKTHEELKQRIEAQAFGTKATAADIQKALDQTKREANNAAVMAFSLFALGASIYMISQMMSDEDEVGRNKVATDDSVRWTRYARFFVFGKDYAIQIPWGFGLGAFASAGAQVAAMMNGNAKPLEAMANIVGNSMDSFLPLPVSRMSVFENPIQFTIDSAVPSILRPFVEYAMNKDGLGRDIYNNRQGLGTPGSPYTGGDNIPQMYKDAATSLFEATGVAVGPNTLYFFANNYVDGLARVGASAWDWSLIASGKKDFEMRRGTLVLDSFIGAPSNYDSKLYSEAEKKIKNIDARLKNLENNPEALARYLESHPTDMALVQYYNSSSQQELRDVREIMNNIRENRELTPKEKKEQLDVFQPVQNTIKRNLVSVYNQIGDLENR